MDDHRNHYRSGPARTQPLSASLLGDELENRRNQLRATLPSGRVVEPADVAALAVHIMTSTALTGGTCDIDGGEQLVSACRTHMRFLVEFEVAVPDGTPESEVKDRMANAATA